MPLRIYALLPGRKLVPARVRVFLDALEGKARDHQTQVAAMA